WWKWSSWQRKPGEKSVPFVSDDSQPCHPEGTPQRGLRPQPKKSLIAKTGVFNTRSFRVRRRRHGLEAHGTTRRCPYHGLPARASDIVPRTTAGSPNANPTPLPLRGLAQNNLVAKTRFSMISMKDPSSLARLTLDLATGAGWN